jgi:hypothetical protein
MATGLTHLLRIRLLAALYAGSAASTRVDVRFSWLQWCMTEVFVAAALQNQGWRR